MPERPEYLLQDGSIVPYEAAQIHVLSPAMKYAASVFEGIRAYWNQSTGQLHVFRLGEHLQRLEESAKVARIPLSYSRAELADMVLKVIRANDLREDLHIRVLAYITDDNGSLAAHEQGGIAIAAMPMQRYDVGKQGVNVCVSSWVRNNDNAMPPRIKANGNYHNSRLALLQARADGYDDALMLNDRGKVTEGPGYNLFAVRKGHVLTPPVTNNILEGITRDTLIHLFETDLGEPVTEREIDRTELYSLSEAFFCGSAKEVTPILSIDRFPVGDGEVGPRSSAVREAYFRLVRGEGEARPGWLTPVYEN